MKKPSLIKPKVTFEDWGVIPFEEAWNRQSGLAKNIIDAKRKALSKDNYFIICEHPHVYTIGKSGSMSNLLVDEEFLEKHDITALKINRGGDITYHGPGQIVGYPILDLDEFFTDIHRYIRYIEEIVIRTLADFGLDGFRIPDYTGVWLPGDKPDTYKKICAIGVHLSRWVTMHGFAFNVNSQLNYFEHIVPCGIQDDNKSVTSLVKELGHLPNIDLIKASIIRHFQDLFLDPENSF